MSRPTIDDIARLAGVSKGTVSRVINRHSTVAERTRAEVLRVMNDVGYAPDPAARHLSWRTGQTLALSRLPGDPTLSPYQVLFRRALERETAPAGVQLIEVTGLTPQRWTPSAALIMHLQQDDPRLGHYAALGVPTVLIGHHPDCAWVAPDDRGGAALAARTLLGLGHRQLLYLGVGDSQVARDREAGFTDAAQRAGAVVSGLPGSFNSLGAYRQVRRAWETGRRFTALFAATDEEAVGAVAALTDLGVAVPAQVSVLGFDGLPELPMPMPLSLSTIVQDIDRIALMALTLVREVLDGARPRGEYIPVTLRPGQTLAPPPP